MLVKGFATLVLSLLFRIVLGQGVAFTTSCGAKQVVMGGTFEVVFTLENADGKQFQPPNFSPFKLVSGPSQSYQSTFINGKGTRSSSFSYTLQATKVGTFSIAGATMLVNGKKLKSNAVQLQVVRQAANLAQRDEEINIFIRAELDTNNLYVGQQAIIRYKIYTQVNIENYNILTESSYDGCFTQVLDSYKERVIKEVVDGVEFSTKVLRKVAVFPQQNGKIEIEPLVARIGIPDPTKKRRSFFSGFNLKTETISSNDLTLLVKSPYEGAPKDYSGAVGHFKAQFSVNPLLATTNDAITVRLRIVGNGDIKMVRVPQLQLPEAFEFYDPKVKDEKMINATDSVRGEKIIEYLVIAKQPGTYILRPSFTYFDPVSDTFPSIRDSFSISIKPGKGFDLAQADNKLRASGEDQIAGPILSTSLRRVRKPLILRPWYWSAFGLPVLGFLLLAWRTKVQHRTNMDEQVDHTAIAQARLAEAKKYLDDQEAGLFFEELALCLKNYISSKSAIASAELSKELVRKSLQESEALPDTIDHLIQVLDQCDFALYAGIHDHTKMEETYQYALQVVKNLEQEISN